MVWKAVSRLFGSTWRIHDLITPPEEFKRRMDLAREEYERQVA